MTQQLALDLKAKAGEIEENPTIIDEGLNALIQEGEAPTELINLVSSLKEQGVDKELMAILGDPEMNKMFKQILSCEGYNL